MKIIKMTLLVLVSVIYTTIVYAHNNYEFSQISQVKLVTDYPIDTSIDDMDTVTFGLYPQSDESGTIKDPIEWIVLERQGDRTLLLSKYLLDKQYFNDEKKYITWENSVLRNWLNTTFLNSAFSLEEQNYIKTTEVINNGSNRYGIDGGNNTNDKIFLLSVDEIDKYFVHNIKNSNDRYYNYDKRLEARYTPFQNGKHGNAKDLGYYWGSFWTRSPGRGENCFMIVESRSRIDDGYSALIRKAGYIVDSFWGIRPAIWVSNPF